MEYYLSADALAMSMVASLVSSEQVVKPLQTSGDENEISMASLPASPNNYFLSLTQGCPPLSVCTSKVSAPLPW